MIDLNGKDVRHVKFGNGRVILCDEDYLTVDFQGISKKFKFPDVFEKFLRIEEKELDVQIQYMLSEHKAAQNRIKEEQNVLLHQRMQKIYEQTPVKSVRQAAFVRENIALKCNYCDGGCTAEQLGYSGVCSDEMIEYNIKVKKRTWCSQDQCMCKKYYAGEISREELDDFGSGDGFVCYESQMLRNWKAMGGVYTQGMKKGEPMKFKKVQANSLAILTTREPGSKESDRMIFALFLVGEFAEGDSQREGYVEAASKYRLKFSREEAHRLLFWKYHANERNSSHPAWSSGLHRYFNDVEAVQILRDAAAIKKGTADEALAREFLQYFCRINRLDPNEKE